MSKKYLSLDEAAQLLSIKNEELVRLREQGEIRGFADRGTWKFKQEDVESLSRKRQADSTPEVPLFVDDGSTPATELPFSLVDPSKGKDPLYDSDSDVRLVGGAEMDLSLSDSDSDVKLVGLDQTVTGAAGLGTDPELNLLNTDSDSEVKLIRPDSDSDVSLPGDDSDSDVKLVGGKTDSDFPIMFDDSDTGSDITLAPDSFKQSDSDVKLMGDMSAGDVTFIGDDDEDAVAIDFKPGSSALDDESGISLGGDSALLLGESGISLEGPADSGIALDDDDDEGLTLALDDDSGISISSGDSGISLDSAGDSGISLDDTIGTGTVPMMDIMPGKGGKKKDVAETQFELPSIKDDDSGYDLRMDDDATGVLDLNTQEDAALSDAVFDVDEEEEATFDAEDDLDLEADAFEDEEGLDVFDADDEAFSTTGTTQGFASAGATRGPAVESDWGTGVFVLLTVSSIFMMVCGAVMLDLVKNTATAAQPNPVSGALLDWLGKGY